MEREIERISSYIDKIGTDINPGKPIIFNLGRRADRQHAQALIRRGRVKTIIDSYQDQLLELLEVGNPNHARQTHRSRKKLFSTHGVWVYIPWRYSLVHLLNSRSYQRVRLSRNKCLISVKDQSLLARSRIGIAGLNVGNAGAICLALTSTISLMKFSDNDALSLSNLNRFRASIVELGLNKAVLTAQQVYEINPFADIELFSRGISQENINNFLIKPRLDLLIEEMDNLPLKILIRERARHYKIPVLMVTGNSSGVIIDVERYDLNAQLPIMNGLLSDKIVRDINLLSGRTITPSEKATLARDFIGAKYLKKELRGSFSRVGKTLAGIPQISEATFLRGAALSFFARTILCGGSVKSGRYSIDLDALLK